MLTVLNFKVTNDLKRYIVEVEESRIIDKYSFQLQCVLNRKLLLLSAAFTATEFEGVHFPQNFKTNRIEKNDATNSIYDDYS